MQGYSDNADRATLDRKAAQARERRARKKSRREAANVLKGMKVLAVQEAIARAERREKVLTKDGQVRVLRIGPNVAAMCRQLLHWEGKGEASGEWIHKSAVEWEDSDAALTPAKLRTARQVGQEEELWEERTGFRPGDRRPTVYYRLNVWRLAQVVVASEIANTERLLARERRKSKRATLRSKLKELEQARNDLGLIDGPASGNLNPHSGEGTEEPSEISTAKKDSGACEQGSSRVAADTPATLTGVRCQDSQLTGESTPGDFSLQETPPVGTGASPGDAPVPERTRTTSNEHPFQRYCEQLTAAGLEVTYDDRLIVPGGLKRLAETAQPRELEAVMERIVEERLYSGVPMSPRKAWEELFTPSSSPATAGKSQDEFAASSRHAAQPEADWVATDNPRGAADRRRQLDELIASATERWRMERDFDEEGL